MNDVSLSTQAAPAELAAEHARITAELRGLSAGTDPFVAAVRATRMPVVITNPRIADNPVVFANDAFCRLTGYPREDIVGRNCRFLQGPETDRETLQRLRDAVRMAKPIDIDIRNHRKGGEPFWNRLLIAPVHDRAGKLAYFFASQVDVTLERERLAGLETHNAALLAELSDRLRAQEENEARLRFATQAGRLGIWELDLRSGELMTSAICREIFGRDSGQRFTYADLLDAIHPQDRTTMQAAVDHSLNSGSECRIEMRIVRAAAGSFWVDARAQVMHASDGTPLRLAGTALDITERKQAEASSRALLELDNCFRTLETPAQVAGAAAAILGRTLEVSRAGYGTVDPAGEMLVVEHDWHVPGLEPITGTLPLSQFTGNDRQAAGQAFVIVPVTEQDRLVALCYVASATPRVWAADTRDFLGEVALRTRMVVERRRAEQNLRQLAASLEAQVASRTEALMQTEAALRQSQKMEAVGQLTGGLAHDFNNLLTGISGSLELLKARVAQGRLADVGRYVNAAQDAANRAASLTHRLLAFSRQQTLEPKHTDVNRLIAGLEELIRHTVGLRVDVVVAGARELWPIMVDQSQLENALLNLCINGRDAMPEGGQLTIRTSNQRLDAPAAAAQELAAGDYVALSVSDIGTGMTPEVIARAFDPFFTTKPLGQGTGLGLSMIYGFAQQSGGRVHVQSELGAGTTVRLFLPRHMAPAQ